MAIEDDVMRKKQELSSIKTLQEINNEQEIYRGKSLAKSLFDIIYQRIITEIARTSVYKSSGVLCGQVGYKDAEDIALWERIIDTVVRKKVSTQSRNEGLFKLRSNYYAIETAYKENDSFWNAFFSEFNRLTKEHGISTKWYIVEIQKKTRHLIDPNTFTAFTSEYLVPPWGRKGPSIPELLRIEVEYYYSK